MNAVVKVETLELVRYDSMCRAIAECVAVDEVKDLRDKARALEVYLRQAKNHDAEDRAREIRLRAERRAGDLMLKQIKSAGTRGTMRGRDSSGGVIVTPPEKNTPSFADQGISKQQAKDWQAIATIPEPQFDAALHDRERPPTTASMVALAPKHVVKAVNGAAVIERETILLHGYLRDFERKGFADKDPADVYGGMTATMQADWQRIVPTMINWLSRLPFMKEPS
jgi:hypothetical protein